jgi:mono/diheme cytochrome c family protein
VPFAAGNFPATPGAVNVGQPEVAEVPEPATQTELFQQLPEITEIPNPVAPTAASLARGEVVFNRACSPCHGAAGDGTGLVTRSGIPSFSLLTPQAAAYTDGYLYTLIRVGRGIMPPYGHQITHYDRWHVVNYVRQLQGPLAAAEDAAAEPAQE